MSKQRYVIAEKQLAELRLAARDRTPVIGLTHCFYKYPARFSPRFVAAAIDAFSKPGEVVLDPFMGGGTTIIEALMRQRRVVGCDLNSLAVFVTSVKTTPLSAAEATSVSRWANDVVADLSYHDAVEDDVAVVLRSERTRNLELPRARPAKKLFAQALVAAARLQSVRAQNFARCVLLNVGQWALNGRKVAPPLSELRTRIRVAAHEMLSDIRTLSPLGESSAASWCPPTLVQGTAADLPGLPCFREGAVADLVVTSPPYPGIHVLYHRWQVDGRKETPAPYWIADCLDGRGASYYNFADRSESAEDEYFEEVFRTFSGVRTVVRPGAWMLQMLAFAKPRRQLPRYLEVMRQAGFEEVREAKHDSGISAFRRVWRPIPGRTWYASQKGNTHSSREVVLIHRAAG